MTLLSFNCRGLGNFSAVNSLRNLIRREAPSIIFLSETKLSSSEFHKIRDILGDFHSIAMDYVERSGVLPMMWHRDVVVDLLSLYVYHIDVMVQSGLGEEEWRCLVFTGGLKFIIDTSLGL